MSVGIIIMLWKKGGCTVSFLGIHKWGPDIYTGFSPALHLQCTELEFLKNLWGLGTE